MKSNIKFRDALPHGKLEYLCIIFSLLATAMQTVIYPNQDSTALEVIFSIIFPYAVILRSCRMIKKSLRPELKVYERRVLFLLSVILPLVFAYQYDYSGLSKETELYEIAPLLVAPWQFFLYSFMLSLLFKPLCFLTSRLSDKQVEH